MVRVWVAGENELCDLLVTHGSCLSFTITVLRDSCTTPVLRGSFMLTVIVTVCVQFNKRTSELV